MKFTVTRLCGGKAQMVTSGDVADIDLNKASEILSKMDFTVKNIEEGLMLVMEWKMMEVTIYPQGKIMFFPLSEKELAVEYAAMIMNKII